MVGVLRDAEGAGEGNDCGRWRWWSNLVFNPEGRLYPVRPCRCKASTPHPQSIACRQAANDRPPTRPVAVASTPAAAAAATPLCPKMSTVAPAPTLGPTGSWPIATMAINTAMASKIDAFTPTACNNNQLRAICAKTAINTNRNSRRPSSSRCRTASPCQSGRAARTLKRRSPNV
jgi:hypothetical protein